MSVNLLKNDKNISIKLYLLVNNKITKWRKQKWINWIF